MHQSITQNRDGFQVWEGKFTYPAETWTLDPRTKRAVTICNLFVNHHYSISDVVRVLDEDRRHVVLVLLKQGLIRDRRLRQTIPPQSIERRKSDLSPN
jgi:hypothetical protein